MTNSSINLSTPKKNLSTWMGVNSSKKQQTSSNMGAMNISATATSPAGCQLLHQVITNNLSGNGNGKN